MVAKNIRARRVSRTSISAVFGALIALACSSVAISSPADPGSDYVRPHQAVDVGAGRKINLLCIGNGKTTVLFDSGLSDWSSIWALVQPAVAKRARACSYDRAGMGYSDPSDEPRAPINIVEDMHKLVHHGALKTPLILVGHSLGGFNMKLYAALYPEDVAGMVLVDPAEDRLVDRTRVFLRRRYGTSVAARVDLLNNAELTSGIVHFNECAASARAHDLDPSSKFYKSCTDPVRPPLGAAIAAERARLQVGRSYQAAQSSEFANSVYADHRGDKTYAMLFRPGAFGNRPLIILTHSIYDRNDPLEMAGFAAWNEAHKQTARLSARGCNLLVPKTHHNIEVDDPNSIVAAVFTVLNETKLTTRESQVVRTKTAVGLQQ